MFSQWFIANKKLFSMPSALKLCDDIDDMMVWFVLFNDTWSQ